MNDDRRLIADTLAGRTSAFNDLVLRYQDRLYHSVLRVVDRPEDALDALQDAFINAYTSLGTFKGDAEFYTWLYRIAFNSAVSLKRRKRQTLSLDAARDGDSGGGAIDPVDPANLPAGADLERREDEAILLAALARLSPEHRQILVMKELDGLKYEDIAEVLTVPIGTVRSRIHRARLELKSLLEAAMGSGHREAMGQGGESC